MILSTYDPIIRWEYSERLSSSMSSTAAIKLLNIKIIAAAEETKTGACLSEKEKELTMTQTEVETMETV